MTSAVEHICYSQKDNWLMRNHAFSQLSKENIKNYTIVDAVNEMILYTGIYTKT